MRLPDAIERDLQAIEAEYFSRGGQQAGTPRLRALRASLQIAFQQLHYQYGFVPTAVLSGSEARLVLEAIDSHLYWQLAESNNRNNGDVIADTEEMRPFRELEARLENNLRGFDAVKIPK